MDTSESSSDDTHDSASFSSEGSEISSIPSLSELGRAAAASSSASESEGVLDAAAARRLTDADFQRFGYLSFSLSSGPVADIRAAVDEAFSADLILEEGEPPKDLLCPLTLEIFEDPVVAVDGHTYERVAIEKWFQSKMTQLVSFI